MGGGGGWEGEWLEQRNMAMEMMRWFDVTRRSPTFLEELKLTPAL